MADILKVTTPTTGYENSTRTNPITANDVNIQNVIDPSKVTRPDGQSGYTENPENQLSLNYESNFDKFIQLLKGTPLLMDTFTQLMFTGMGTVVNSGISENFAEEIAQFMDMLKMSEGELLSFLKNQSSSAVRFKGAFFHFLYQTLQETNSVDLKTNILDFLKKYNDMASGNHVLNSIIQNLKTIVKYIPVSYRGSLQEMIEKLEYREGDGKNYSNQGNALIKNSAILKNEIIPFLSNYIGRTHDLGKVRDLITFLTLNIARYENGSFENVFSSFESLLLFQGIKDKIGSINPEQIEAILKNTEFEKAANQNALMDKLTSIIEKGMNSQNGREAKSVFENIVNSILINESVYMPLLHMIIPADVNGNLLFSELWIDPDHENDKEEKKQPEDGRCVKLLIKFDIKEVGFFDLILVSQNGVVDMQLYYPQKLAPMEKVIKTGMNTIIEKNGLSFRSFSIEKCIKPKTISEVFPKIYERKNAVNVKI